MKSYCLDEKASMVIRGEPATDLLGYDVSCKSEQAGPSEMALNFQARTATDVWTYADWVRLCVHLHNENDDTRFVMGFQQDGMKKYVRSKKVGLVKAISWSWSTIQARAKSGLAIVPYATNSDRLSRWGALDFDAHDGNHDRARGYAWAAFLRLVNTDLAVILESSGAGWHLWLISKNFKPVNDWIRLLKETASLISAPLQSGICEIYPPDSICRGFGKGMRAPGSWNPNTDTRNQIYWENTRGLIDSLSEGVSLDNILGREGREEGKEVFLSMSVKSSGLYPLWDKRWSTQFAIKAPNTRNSQLSGLVGEIFHQVGQEMGLAMATAQYERKTVETEATLDDHVKSFHDLWRGLRRSWLQGLTDVERLHLGGLRTDYQRDAFRIIRSYYRKSQIDQMPDFAIAAEDLGRRLGLTKQAGCDIRKEFVRLGIIKMTQPYMPNKAAARYRWMLAEHASPQGHDAPLKKAHLSSV